MQLATRAIRVPFDDCNAVQDGHLVLLGGYVLRPHKVQFLNHRLDLLPVLLYLTRVLHLHRLHLQHSFMVLALQLLIHVHEHRIITLSLLQLRHLSLQLRNEHVFMVAGPHYV